MLFRYKKNAAGKQVRQAIIYTKKEHSIDINAIDIEAIRIIKKLSINGYESYIVGGAVRDLILGNSPKDFDIVTSAEPSKIRRMFRNSRIIGKRFRLVHIYFGEKIFEVATFRSTEAGSIGNLFGTIEEDANRRDFSINALYFDPIKNHIIDYVGGFNDINKQKLVAVIPKNRIFIEDPVRMVRAIKYAVIANCKIPFFLKIQILKNANLLEYTSPSRLTEEINKIITSGHSVKIVKMLIYYHLIEYIQPNAYSFIEDVANFSESFFKSLSDLDTAINNNKIKRQGQTLIYLLRDFIKIIVNTDIHKLDIFPVVYKQCRHFILPMNPQRTELAYAVKFCLNKLGFKHIKIAGKSKNINRNKKNRNKYKTKQKKIL